jgi:hypothetical protein
MQMRSIEAAGAMSWTISATAVPWTSLPGLPPHREKSTAAPGSSPEP